MKIIIIITALLLAAGCATIENRVAFFILNRYAGVWVKKGATDNDRSVDATQCVLDSINPQTGIVIDAQYRACMTKRGWVLQPVPVQ